MLIKYSKCKNIAFRINFCYISSVKIAFVGKGGSGKTTLASTVARCLSSKSLPVIAFDADINQHLGQSLGLREEEVVNIPALGLEIHKIKEYLKGDNAMVTDLSKMVKTTPPARGSRLLTVTENNDLYNHFVKEVEGIKLMAVGPFTKEDLGVKCYHSKTGSVELLLNHMVDKEDEYVLADMTAGADSFSSGLFTRFDITFLVVEPTVKSVGVYKQYKKYAQDHDVAIKVIANKVEDDSDLEFIRERVGNDLVAVFSRSKFIRAMEKGEMLPISKLEPENIKALDNIISEVGKQEKDWDKYYQQAIEFHLKNAKSWANEAAGDDLTKLVDTEFSLKEVVDSM